MNKSELIARVAERTGESKTAASDFVEAVFDEIRNALVSGDEVRVVGFGNFSVTQRAASKGRNPRTHEEISIPASKTPKFRPGKPLKDAVNQ